MKGIAIASLVVAAIVVGSISLTYAAPGRKVFREVPFVGMTLVFSACEGWQSGPMAGGNEIRTVNVLYYNETTNHVIIRDSGTDWLDTMEVDLVTREIVWCSGWEIAPPWYEEYWIPTNIGLGSHVPILVFDAVVVGSTTLSVDGVPVEVWQLQAVWQPPEPGRVQQTIWYYEKQTGIWVAASFVILDSLDGHTVYKSWGGTLISTNVMFPQAID